MPTVVSFAPGLASQRVLGRRLQLPLVSRADPRAVVSRQRSLSTARLQTGVATILGKCERSLVHCECVCFLRSAQSSSLRVRLFRLGQAVCAALSPYVSCLPSLPVPAASSLWQWKMFEVVECVHLVLTLRSHTSSDVTYGTVPRSAIRIASALA